jgi:hypothetical protein
MDRGSAEGTAVPLNFNAPDDGRIGRNMKCSDEFEKDLILSLDIVAWWTVNKTENIFSYHTCYTGKGKGKVETIRVARG